MLTSSRLHPYSDFLTPRLSFTDPAPYNLFTISARKHPLVRSPLYGLFRAKLPGIQSGINTVSKIRQSTLSLFFKDVSASTTTRAFPRSSSDEIDHDRHEIGSYKVGSSRDGSHSFGCGCT